MICVECGVAVNNLIREYSHGNIRLTQCERCLKFVDRYIEHDWVLIFIDMLLHKPQVYRHLLFNRLPYTEKWLASGVFRLAILLTLFDVYIKWFQLESRSIYYSHLSLMEQYLLLLGLCLAEMLVTHFTVRSLVQFIYKGRYSIVKYNYVSMALIISSFPKLLLILMIIWEYNQPEFHWIVSFLVLTSNAEALGVFLELTYLGTVPIILVGGLGRLLLHFIVKRFDLNAPINLF